MQGVRHDVDYAGLLCETAADRLEMVSCVAFLCFGRVEVWRPLGVAIRLLPARRVRGRRLTRHEAASAVFSRP